MTNRFLQILVLLILFASPVMAQQGAISGIVLDKDTGETLIGANVLVEGTASGSTTDLDGQYMIKGLAAGTYNLVVSYIGYNSITVQHVEVQAGETTSINLQMTSEAIGLDEVIVEARSLENTEGALLRERQKSTSVSDAISAEAISRSGSGDAASAMTKVTGASVVAGKYVYIRGLGDRYSSTQLNGSALPSADPYKQSFLPCMDHVSHDLRRIQTADHWGRISYAGTNRISHQVLQEFCSRQFQPDNRTAASRSLQSHERR